MILCDQVIRDEDSHKITIVGSFSTIQSAEFPTVYPNLGLYIAVTDGQGTYNSTVTFRYAETEQRIMWLDAELVLRDPLQVAEISVPIPALPLPRPGKYRIDFSCDGGLVMSRSFLAVQMPKEDAK